MVGLYNFDVGLQAQDPGRARCKVGQLVSAKRALGRVRGASLYVEVRQDGTPVDPESALDKGR